MTCQDTIYQSTGSRVCGRSATMVLIYYEPAPLDQVTTVLRCCDDHALARIRIAAGPVTIIRADLYATLSERSGLPT